MRIRTVLAAAVLAALASLPLAGVASAQQPTDRDCRDFASQAAAQSALRSHSGDPERLDRNHNGVACEEYFKTALPAPAAGQAPPPPVRPVPDLVPPPAPKAGSEPLPPARPVVDQNEKPGVVVAPAEAPADAPVKTVPEHQILVKPQGAPDTGDGSATPLDGTPVVLLVGGLGAAAALGAGHRLARRSR